MPRRTTSAPPPAARRPRRAIRVGDTVIFSLGELKERAVVVEDRGPIGVGGRQLLRIRRITADGDLGPAYEVPAEEVTAGD